LKSFLGSKTLELAKQIEIVPQSAEKKKQEVRQERELSMATHNCFMACNVTQGADHFQFISTIECMQKAIAMEFICRYGNSSSFHFLQSGLALIVFLEIA
jgi:hypothetical protein